MPAAASRNSPQQDGLTIPEEIKPREDRLAKLGKAKQAMEERAKERLLAEQAIYQKKIAERAAKEQSTGKKPGGKAPKPPKEGARDKDQYNFTDPESRIMKMGGDFEQLEVRNDQPAPPPDASVAERMAHRLDTEQGKKLYGKRKETVEPVFGIIKQAIGFRSFLLRGKEKVSLEWTLMSTSYNLKRLFNLGMSFKAS